MSDQIFSRLISNKLFPQLTWLRFFGFEFWMVGFTPFFIGYVVGAKELFGFDLFYGFLIIALTKTIVLKYTRIRKLENGLDPIHGIKPI